MKKTDMEKLKMLKTSGKMNLAATPVRFGKGAGVALDRREQRKLDQALDLVPFAVKLKLDMVKQLRALAQERDTGLNELVAELLKKGLENKAR